ncbi:MAG TPA: TonB-dependent siderophore receptor [Bryobacteraceae bacterium]
MAAKRIKKPRRWIAMGTLAAYAATGSGKIALAQESPPGGRRGHPGQIATLPVRRYNIPPGKFGDVLQAFKAVSGVKSTAANAEILNVQSPGVTGLLTVNEALERIFSNTGVTYRFVKPNAIELDFQSALTSIDVTAKIPELATSISRFPKPLEDIAQTIDVVPHQVMQQQANTTLRDALRNVAGISLAAGEGGAQGDNLTIRGFSARDDLYIDGMRDVGNYYRDPFNAQEVEVLKGPASVIFGRGSTGGVVNQASKTPDLDRFFSGDLDFGTDATRRATVDVNIPVPALGSGAAFRMNAMGDIGGVAGRDVAENRRDGFAPSLALGLGTPTRLIFSYFHQNEDDIPDYGIPWLFNGPAPANHSNYYGLENDNFLRAYADIGTVCVEHDINSHITMRNQVRYANYADDIVVTVPRLQTSGSGALSLSTPLSDILVKRSELANQSTNTFLDDQLDLTAHFETGFLRHTFVTGVEGGRETSDPIRRNYTAPMTSLLDPDPSESINPGVTMRSQVYDTALTAGLYAIDTVKFGRKWELTGGLRFDRFDDTYLQTVTPASNFERVDQKPTWRVALVYHPVPIGSLYFDAGTSFNPSAEALSLSAGTANLPPETNRSYEFGTKWEFDQGRLAVNSSWFRTTKENAREQDPDNSLLYVLGGDQRVSGAEFDIRGRLTSRWDVLASYAYLDSKVVGSEFYPEAIGYPLANVPKNSFDFWSTYRLPHRVELGLGADYESSRTASDTEPLDPTTGLLQEAPRYWVFNAMASYPVAEHFDIQANVYNMANRYYYDQLYHDHIVPGPGRSALIGLKFKF